MNKHLRNYLNSFKLDSRFLKTIIIDAVTILTIFLLFFALSTNLNHQSEVIGEGKSIEQLKLELVTGTEEHAQQFLERTKSIIFTMLFGGLAVLLASLLTFSYSRKYLWEKLFKKKIKLRSWVLLVVMLTCFLAFYFLFFLVLKIIFNILTAALLSDNIYLLVSKLITFILLITYTIYTFLTFYSFQHHHQVWPAFSQAFQLVKKYKSRLWKMLLLVLVTAILFSVLLLFSTKFLSSYSFVLPFILPIQTISLLTIFQLAFFFLFINWLRLYTAKK